MFSAHYIAKQINKHLRLAIGNSTNPKSESQITSGRVKIFFHERGKFNFFMEQDTMANIMKIEPKMLEVQNAYSFSITKSKFKSLNREERECEDKSDYIWNDCLDEMFYLRKGLMFKIRDLELMKYVLGFQDPWNVNPNVPLPTATNMTIIQSGFRRGPLLEEVDWDQQFNDRPYMAEKEIAGLTRDGKRCRSPCSQMYYEVKQTSLPKAK